MSEAQRFAYLETNSALGAASALPYVPLTLDYQGSAATVSALVDSGDDW